MKTIYSFIKLFFTRIGQPQATGNKCPTGSLGFNLLIMIVTGTYSVSFAERQAYFLKRKLGLDLSFFRKALHYLRLRPDCQKRILFLSDTLKVKASSGKKSQIRGLF